MLKSFLVNSGIVLLWFSTGITQISQIEQSECFGFQAPDDVPKIFAPGIVNMGMPVRDIAMMPDGEEIYFTALIGGFSVSAILVTRLNNGRLTEPEVMKISSIPTYHSVEPSISPDGKRFFFVSDRPNSASDTLALDFDIWVMDRQKNDWSDPRPIGVPVNSPFDEYFPTVTRNGTIYFTRENPDKTNFILRSQFIDRKYSEPERLPVQVNCGRNRFNAVISPDESYIILCVFGREDSHGSTDYYIVFRTPDDKWSEPMNLGDRINTAGGQEYSPYVSPDGKYFFFMSSRFDEKSLVRTERLTWDKLRQLQNQPGNGTSAIWWMEAKFIDELRKTAVFKQ